MKKIPKKRLLMVLGVSALLFTVLQFTGCRSSEFQDIFKRCAPDCLVYESPLALPKTVDAFEQVIGTAQVSDNDLSGRWVMISTKRYFHEQADEKTVTDILFTKAMVFTEDVGSLTVSDCYQSEIYTLAEDRSFVIPKDSVFFSSLYFQNDNDIMVNAPSNIRLGANWQITSLQGVEIPLSVSMYKVNDSNLVSANIGDLFDPFDVAMDINCYSFLNLYVSGEKKFAQQWIPFEGEVQELILKINDPDMDDLNVALALDSLDGSPSTSIVYNQGIDGWEYRCFGDFGIGRTRDLLSFEGSFTIALSDANCLSKALGTYVFSFSPL